MEFQFNIINKLDILFICIFTVIGLIILFLSYAFSINQYDIGLTFIIASIIYYNIKNFNSSNISTKKPFIGSNIISWVAIALSVLCLFFLGEGWGFYILICGSIFIVAYNIINNEKYVPIVQSLIIGLILKSSSFFTYPSLRGNDIWIHIAGVKEIIKNEALPDYNSLLGRYIDYPIFHLAIVNIREVLDIDLKISLFIFSIAMVITISIILYIICSKLFNEKISLIVVLLFNISDMFTVRFATNITPGTVVITFFIIVLYIYLFRNNNIKFILLTLIFLLIMIITHQLTTFIVLILLLSIYLTNRAYSFFSLKSHEEAMGFSLILLFLIGIISYWGATFQVPGKNLTFLEFVIKPIIEIIVNGDFIKTLDSNPYVIYSSEFTIISNLLYHFGYIILLFFAIIGFLLLINRINCKITIILSLSCVLFCTIYAASLTGLQDRLIPIRWLPFLYLFLIIMAGFSLIYINSISKNRLIMPLLITILTFFMITTPMIDFENPLYLDSRSERTAFNLQETNAALYITTYSNESLTTDGTFKNTIMRQFKTPTNYLDFEDNNLSLIRKSIVIEPISQRYIGSLMILEPYDASIMHKFIIQSKIYSNNNVYIYYKL